MIVLVIIIVAIILYILFVIGMIEESMKDNKKWHDILKGKGRDDD